MGYMIDSDILFDLIHSELKTFLSPLNSLISDDRIYHFEMAIGGIIKQAGKLTPTAEAPGWIPCYVRLPDKADHKEDMVLVCHENGAIRFNAYRNGWVQGNPVAWMPLPEPFGGDKHE